jgi:p-cumate 2,3-dioxygenase alpha subunit
MNETDIAGLVVDDREGGIFRVNRKAFTDPVIHAIEKKRVFDSTWLYVGHESEVARPGDYLTRKVGGRPIIFVRDDRGQVRVFFNTCPHRGNAICREHAGNGKSFQCFYHAWTFNTRGELVGLPGADGYGPGFDRKQMGMVSPARVDGYRGLVFLSFNPDVESLITFLAGAREYIDLMIDYSDEELEIVQGAQAYSMRANWKLLVENSIDGYHALPTHQRFFKDYLSDIGVDTTAWSQESLNARGVGLELGNGHALIESPAGGLPVGAKATGQLADHRKRLEEKFGVERAERICDFSRNLLVFPNLIFIANWKTVRTFYPVAPDYIEIDSWALLPTNDTPELRKIRMDNYISFLGPGGFGTPDDVEALEACQRGFVASDVGWSDISRGMHREKPYTGDELQMRAFWRQWKAQMTGRQPVYERMIDSVAAQ